MTTCYSCGVNKKKKLIIVPPWFLLLIFFSSGAFGVMSYFIRFKQKFLGVVEGGLSAEAAFWSEDTHAYVRMFMVGKLLELLPAFPAAPKCVLTSACM